MTDSTPSAAPRNTEEQMVGCQYPGCRNQASHRLRGKDTTDWTSFCYQHASEAYDRDPLLETEEIESANTGAHRT